MALATIPGMGTFFDGLRTSIHFVDTGILFYCQLSIFPVCDFAGRAFPSPACGIENTLLALISPVLF